jgi:hypothetical protein
MSVLSKIMQIPALGKMVLKNLKKNAFSAFQIPLENALEKQEKCLQEKFRRMANTNIGAKMGVRADTKIGSISLTDYEFYEPFYNNPSPGSLMYRAEDYARIKTSGTTGRDKWFLVPRKAMRKVLRETALPVIFSLFHDGEKITLEYGDTMYLNLGPAPFLSGSMFNMGSSEKRAPFLNLVPNINLSFKEKVDFFILNYRQINAAWFMASTIVTRVMPDIDEPVKLKGLMLIDDLVARAYKSEITKFFDTSPKTLYASTETIAPTIPSVQHSMGFIFDLRRGIFEFEEIGKTQNGEEKPVELNEVKVGNVYRLIYTDLIGELTRYNTDSSFKCVAKGDDAIGSDFPVFEYHARLDRSMSIMNFTRIDEKELMEAFQGAGIQFMDFTAKVERDGGHEYLNIYVELLGKKSDKEVEREIHKYLYSTDQDYKMLSDLFGYIPLKVISLPTGIFAKYLEDRKGAYPKVSRIDMDKEDFAKLMLLAKMQ